MKKVGNVYFHALLDNESLFSQTNFVRLDEFDAIGMIFALEHDALVASLFGFRTAAADFLSALDSDFLLLGGFVPCECLGPNGTTWGWQGMCVRVGRLEN